MVIVTAVLFWGIAAVVVVSALGLVIVGVFQGARVVNGVRGWFADRRAVRDAGLNAQWHADRRWEHTLATQLIDPHRKP
jgi:hypothetical protein